MTTATVMVTELSMTQVVCDGSFCGHIQDDLGQLFSGQTNKANQCLLAVFSVVSTVGMEIVLQ